MVLHTVIDVLELDSLAGTGEKGSAMGESALTLTGLSGLKMKPKIHFLL